MNLIFIIIKLKSYTWNVCLFRFSFMLKSWVKLFFHKKILHCLVFDSLKNVLQMWVYDESTFNHPVRFLKWSFFSRVWLFIVYLIEFFSEHLLREIWKHQFPVLSYFTIQLELPFDTSHILNIIRTNHSIFPPFSSS